MLKALFERLKSPPAGSDQRIELAAAALLLEVSFADQSTSAAERARILDVLAERFGLDATDAGSLLASAEAAHADSVGLQASTRLLTEAWDEPARYALVVRLWELALVDDGIDRYEEHVIRRIAELLYVEHPRFIAARREARQNLGLPSPGQ